MIRSAAIPSVNVRSKVARTTAQKRVEMQHHVEGPVVVGMWDAIHPTEPGSVKNPHLGAPCFAKCFRVRVVRCCTCGVSFGLMRWENEQWHGGRGRKLWCAVVVRRLVADLL